MSFKKILRITWNEVKLTFSGFGRFYIEYFRALINIKLHPLAILDWLIMVLFFLILFLHPYFPASIKLLSSIFVIVVSYKKTKSFVRNSRYTRNKQHARIRGGILALFPFYLVAVTTFIWGLWEVWPGNNYQKSQLENAEFKMLIEKDIMVKGDYGKKSKIHETDDRLLPGNRKYDVKAIRDQDGNPLLNVLNDAYPGKTPKDKEFVPDYENPLTFWIYSLKVTLRMNFAGIIEIIHNTFVDEENNEEKLYITRLDGWHEFMLVLEVILQAITSILFLGIIADIALSVQHKIQTGEIDIDLSRDYSIELLKSVNELDTLAEVDYTIESWNKIEQIQKRAIENLREKLATSYPISLIETENILKIRNSTVTKKVAAILTLGSFKAKSALPDLIEQLEDESLRVRCAAIGAIARIDIIYLATNFKNLFESKHEIQRLTLLKELDEFLSKDEESASGKEKKEQLLENIKEQLIDGLVKSREIRGLLINILRFYDRKELHNLLFEAYDACKNEHQKEVLIHTFGALNFEDTLIGIFKVVKEKGSKDLLVAVLIALQMNDVMPVQEDILNIAQNKKFSYELKNQAILALGNADVSTLESLLEFLDTHELAESALQSISQLVSKAIKEKLVLPEKFFEKIKGIIEKTNTRSIREQACLALARTKDEQAYEILLNQLPKPEAAIALGILGNENVVPELVKAATQTFDTPSYSNEHSAPIEALGSLGTPGLQALQELYGKRKKDRATIALVIAKMNLPDAVDFLLAKFHPESLESCKMLAPALANTQDDRVKRPLLNAVKQNPEAASVITHALLGFEDEKMVEEILRLISVFNDEIRNEVFQTFKFYRPKKKNVEVLSNMQKYFGTFSSKAENWAKKLNKILQKHTDTKSQNEKSDNLQKIDINALDEFD